MFHRLRLISAAFALLTFSSHLAHATSVCGALSDFELAVTCQFTGSGGGGAGTPVSAITAFDWNFLDPAKDPAGTSDHELFHGIGFTANYTNFANRLTVNGGVRDYKDAANNILAVLTLGQTHLVDADFTGTGNATNQQCDLMTPDLRAGCAIPYTISALDKTLINTAFGAFGGYNINVVFGNADQWTLAERNTVTASAGRVQNAFPGGAAAFTWTVFVVPEPASSALVLAGLAAIAAIVRRRHSL